MNRLVLVNLCMVAVNAAVYVGSHHWVSLVAMILSSCVACAVWSNK